MNPVRPVLPPADDLMLALPYRDDVMRAGEDRQVIRRETVKQLHRGPFPRPTIGPPSHPRS